MSIRAINMERNFDVEPGVGVEMHKLLSDLFPICRSLTGEGVRKTLSILSEHIPLKVYEVPTGTSCFDWTVPNEWNIRDAWVKDASGKKIIDFKNNNLHVVGYSEPVHARMSLDDLKKHLFTLTEQPSAIPYITSYYSRRWGFCLTYSQFASLDDGEYEVFIDSDLEPGALTFADFVIPGETEREILISTYICHPSMANNELSGPIVATYLAKHLLGMESRHYTYRFIFVPETIGSIVYLSLHKEQLTSNTVGGYVVTCCGDEGNFSYLQSRSENTLVDRTTIHMLNYSERPFNLYSFLERGSDERQYCSPGIDLPVGSLMRTKYNEYPQYHTSLDDLTYVTENGLEGTLALYLRCIEAIEFNHKFQATVLCEPQLGRRGLYPTLSTRESGLAVRTMMNLLAYADGDRDLVGIADKIGVSVSKLIPMTQQLVERGLLKQIEDKE